MSDAPPSSAAPVFELAPDAPRVLVEDELVVRATDDPDDPLLSAFYDGYDRSFVLPSEKEELAGFRECLALNHGPRYDQLAARLGPFRELVVVVEGRVGGATKPLGGANFICYPTRGSRPGGTRAPLAMNLNYIFILAGQRRRGYFSRLLAACATLARGALRATRATSSSTTELLVFLEQNDPLAMSAADYARDSAHSGLDQLQRIGIWARMGARLIDFPYIQPSLSASQTADRGLVLAVLGAARARLDACVLRDHLERFFTISVLKGEDAAMNADASAQLAALDHRCAGGLDLPLVDPTPWLPELGALVHPSDPASGGILAAIQRLQGAVGGIPR